MSVALEDEENADVGADVGPEGDSGDDVRSNYTPDEPGDEIDGTGQLTGGKSEPLTTPHAPIQAEVMKSAFSQGPGGGHSPVKAREVKMMSALALRIQGHSYDTIAAELGYKNAQSASRMVNEALKRQTMDNAKSFIEVQDRRYNYLLASMFRKAIDANSDLGEQTSAVSATLAIMRQHENLLGVDKVVADATSNEVIMIDSESADYVTKLQSIAKENELPAVAEAEDDQDELREHLHATDAEGWEQFDQMYDTRAGDISADVQIIDAEVTDE